LLQPQAVDTSAVVTCLGRRELKDGNDDDAALQTAGVQIRHVRRPGHHDHGGRKKKRSSLKATPRNPKMMAEAQATAIVRPSLSGIMKDASKARTTPRAAPMPKKTASGHESGQSPRLANLLLRVV
jgi:hypothetical protein